MSNDDNKKNPEDMEKNGEKDNTKVFGMDIGTKRPIYVQYFTANDMAAILYFILLLFAFVSAVSAWRIFELHKLQTKIKIMASSAATTKGGMDKGVKESLETIEDFILKQAQSSN